MVAPETIKLSTIYLRRPRISDAEAIFEYGSDPEVARYADWPISTSIEPIIALIHERKNRWASGTEFYWVITLPDADRAIGGISYQINGHKADFGYLLNRRYWDNGFATEASQAIVDWLFTEPSIWRVWATCDTENLASARVLEKVGLEREGILRRWAIRPNVSSEPRDAYIYAKVR